jgi:hypothetical protein
MGGQSAANTADAFGQRAPNVPTPPADHIQRNQILINQTMTNEPNNLTNAFDDAAAAAMLFAAAAESARPFTRLAKAPKTAKQKHNRKRAKIARKSRKNNR